jgi:hypothetical protein
MQDPLPIFRSTDAGEAGVHATTLRRRTSNGHPHGLIRLAPNAYVPRTPWNEAGPRLRHVTRIHAIAGRLDSATASHVSAAAVHGLPSLTGWPDAVHVTVPRSHVRRRTPSLVTHSRPLRDDERVLSATLPLTSIERTAVDTALDEHRRVSVVLLDAVLRNGVPRERILAALDALPSPRGRTSAAAAIEFADGAADSVSESLARVVFDELGTPPPILQQVFRMDGREYRVDFWFPEQGVIIEIDGRAKYEQTRYLNGRSAADVFIDEKRRHERLLSMDGVRQVIRLEWRDLFDRRTLVLRLRKTGIPCRAVDELSACSLLVA